MLVIRLAAILSILSMGISGCDRPADQAPETQQAQPAPAAAVALERTPSAAGARVFFITPSDGDRVSNPISIEFGIEGMQVAKAGEQQPDSGHHHLLIDTELPDPDLPIPADSSHIHFGDGRTSTEISLDPGTHSLRMLLGDYRHVPHDPPIASDPITITVE